MKIIKGSLEIWNKLNIRFYYNENSFLYISFVNKRIELRKSNHSLYAWDYSTVYHNGEKIR